MSIEISNGTAVDPSLDAVIIIVNPVTSHSDSLVKKYVHRVIPMVETFSGVTRYQVTIEMDGQQAANFPFYLDEVTNQPTWTLDDTGLEQAVLDVNSWLMEGDSSLIAEQRDYEFIAGYDDSDGTYILRRLVNETNTVGESTTSFSYFLASDMSAHALVGNFVPDSSVADVSIHSGYDNSDGTAVYQRVKTYTSDSSSSAPPYIDYVDKRTGAIHTMVGFFEADSESYSPMLIPGYDTEDGTPVYQRFRAYTPDISSSAGPDVDYLLQIDGSPFTLVGQFVSDSRTRMVEIGRYRALSTDENVAAEWKEGDIIIGYQLLVADSDTGVAYPNKIGGPKYFTAATAASPMTMIATPDFRFWVPVGAEDVFIPHDEDTHIYWAVTDGDEEHLADADTANYSVDSLTDNTAYAELHVHRDSTGATGSPVIAYYTLDRTVPTDSYGIAVYDRDIITLKGRAALNGFTIIGAETGKTITVKGTLFKCINV